MGLITSADNPAVRAARRLASQPGRVGTDELLVEGPQVVREAVPYLRRLFVTAAAAQRHADLVRCARERRVAVATVSDAVMGSITGTVTPQGLAGVAVLPGASLDTAVDGATWLLVLCEVRDPGNVGTIVRTADAAGVDAVAVSRASVDVRNPKTVRASAGSLFHLPVVRDVGFAAVAAACRGRGLQLVGASPRGGVEYTDVVWTRPSALVLGNEAAGLSRDALARCDLVARVPVQRRARPGHVGAAESLNLAAAGAVLLFEAARQRRGTTIGARTGGPRQGRATAAVETG